MTATRLSVLHFSTADTLGGSARSAYRVHSGLRARGHRSRMLVGYRLSDDPDVRTVSGGRILNYADRLADRMTARIGRQYTFLPSSARTARHPWVAEADVIQLFNTHGGYFAQQLLPRLAAHAPIVWRLSDMWAMTGHCSYSADCEGWLDGCGACPYLGTYPRIGRDRTAELFQLKRRLYAGLPLTIIVPSTWMERLALQSPLLSPHPIVRIPNGLAGSAFVPQNRTAARGRLSLPVDARIILFAAHVLDDNPRKGGDVLMRALTDIGTQPGWAVALVGEGGESWTRLPLPVHRLGFHSTAEMLSLAYAAADVVAIPSVLDNLPNTLIESLACGRAVVATDCGGMRDGVIPNVTGLLVAAGDSSGLAAALMQVLGDDALRESMEREARAHFQREFSPELELDRFEALYGEIVDAPFFRSARRNAIGVAAS